MSYRVRYRAQQIQMIAEIDKCLHLLRKNWMDALSAVAKASQMDRIDAMLDQRIIMMRNRDR